LEQSKNIDEPMAQAIKLQADQVAKHKEIYIIFFLSKQPNKQASKS
jgi:hypothetical protein